MEDNNLYTKILELSPPWEVNNVALNIEEGEINIYVAHTLTRSKCPDCGQVCSIYDHRQERKWRHLDTCQIRTYINCSVPRIKCNTHGVKTINVPWADSSDRVTIYFEKLAIDLILATKNQTKVAEILRVGFKVVHHIMKKAVDRGLSDR